MLYVAIGRNVGEVPMSDDLWREFCIAAEECVMDGERLATADTMAEGESRYGDMKEDCRVLVWFDVMANLRGDTILNLTAIAKEFGQECIAWSVAPTNFTGGV